MIDIETIGIEHDSVVLSLGAVQFDPFSENIGKSIYIKPSVDEQFEIGRTYNDDTLEWWSKQDKAVLDEAFDEIDRVTLHLFVKQFRSIVANCKRVWAKGPTFDTIILENLFKSIGEPAPWTYSKIRDARTLYDFADSVPSNTSAHDPVADCVIQILVVQQVYKKLGMTNENNRRS